MPDGIRRSRMPLACGLLALTLPALAAEEPKPNRPIVASFERFGIDTKAGPAPAGLLLLGELNCTSCHQANDAQLAHLDRKQAPILDGVGSRVRPGYLRAFLADPHGTKPGTTMPDPFAGMGAAEKAEKVEALVNFLASTGQVAEKAPKRPAIAAGKMLYGQVGCLACHGDAPGSVPLGDLAAKYSIPSLAAFLLDPHKVRPSGRMPGLLLGADEATNLASFLLKDVSASDTRPNVEYAYYEGDWQTLPDFSKLTPKSKGRCTGFDLGQALRENEFGFRFGADLAVPAEGDYTFHIASDDGSSIAIDGKPVAKVDGVHPVQGATGAIHLSKGKHRVTVDFFQDAGGAELFVDYEGPGIGRQELSPALTPLESRKPSPPRKPAEESFTIDPDLASKGQGLFASVGCASCHQLVEGGKPIEPKATAMPLSKLKGNAGCLSAAVPKGLPAFHLDASQRVALASAVAALANPPAPPKAEQVIARTMAALNCYACHKRGEVGGVDEARDRFFETTQKEMGDEGRIPPTLDGVGAKLNADYLKNILAHGAKDRPYMLTRMPKFGEANAGPLAPAFEATDPTTPVAPVTFDLPERKVKAAGRFIVGSQALGCIACHTFKGVQAQGIQAIDMTTMTRRLRRDWFHKYLPDPNALRPGTRMPSGWPMGQSVLPKVLDNDGPRQIEAVWQYLSEGNSAALPFGLGRAPIPLVPEKDAIIYRNFIEGAGSRAIGVGYPEGANLAFDANNMRIALIWQGAFIDAGRHWTDRGDGFQGPLGENVVALPPGPEFATLKSREDAWPEKPSAGLLPRFRGYRLGKASKPTFTYELGSIRVEDFPDAVAGKGDEDPSIRRTLDLAANGPVANTFFRAAVADKIEPLADGWFALSGGPKVRLVADEPPIVRASGGKAELLVPITFRDGKARVVQEIAW